MYEKDMYKMLNDKINVQRARNSDKCEDRYLYMKMIKRHFKIMVTITFS